MKLRLFNVCHLKKTAKRKKRNRPTLSGNALENAGLKGGKMGNDGLIKKEKVNKG